MDLTYYVKNTYENSNGIGAALAFKPATSDPALKFGRQAGRYKFAAA